jgi:hypothetical protein
VGQAAEAQSGAQNEPWTPVIWTATLRKRGGGCEGD